MSLTDGIVAAGFERVRDVFAAQVEREELGAGFAAILNGETLVDLWGGKADRTGAPWRRDTLVPVYSATKPISALTLAHVMDEHGVSFDTSVAELWPEFAAHGKDRVSIGEMLSHQAGVPGFVTPIDTALWLDPPALAARLADEPPMWPPGTASGYHPTTWGYMLGELCMRVSGRSLGSVLRDDVCAPNGIDFWIGLPDAEHARVAEIRRPSRLVDLGPLTPIKRAAFLEKWSGPDRGGAEWRRVEIPSANGHGTALALSQLYGAFANGGALGVEPLMSSRVFGELTKTWWRGQDLVLPFQLDWRAGVLGNNNGFFGPNPNAIGHCGWGGSTGVADAERGLSIGYVMNKQSHHLMGDPRALALIEALYACL